MITESQTRNKESTRKRFAWFANWVHSWLTSIFRYISDEQEIDLLATYNKIYFLGGNVTSSAKWQTKTESGLTNPIRSHSETHLFLSNFLNCRHVHFYMFELVEVIILFLI